MPKLTKKEKNTVEYLSHRLEVRRIWLEKVLLFLIIGGISGGITFFGKLYLEDYKSDLIKREFLLKSRMEGIKEVSSAYSQLVNYLFGLPVNDEEDKNKYCNAYKRSLSSFMDICNKWNALFSEDFERDLQCHYYIHEAIAFEKVLLGNEHFDFISATTQQFDRIIAKALIEETLGEKQKKIEEEWDFDKTNKKNIRSMKSEEFFVSNFKKWKNRNK